MLRVATGLAAASTIGVTRPFGVMDPHDIFRHYCDAFALVGTLAGLLGEVCDSRGLHSSMLTPTRPPEPVWGTATTTFVHPAAVNALCARAYLAGASRQSGGFHPPYPNVPFQSAQPSRMWGQLRRLIRDGYLAADVALLRVTDEHGNDVLPERPRAPPPPAQHHGGHGGRGQRGGGQGSRGQWQGGRGQGGRGWEGSGVYVSGPPHARHHQQQNWGGQANNNFRWHAPGAAPMETGYDSERPSKRRY